MIEFRSFSDADDAGAQRLQHRATVVDGIVAFSEYKAIDMARRGGRTVVGADGEAIVAMGHAAWHRGDSTATPHWAVEVVVDPEHRSTALMAGIVEATVAALPGESPHVLWGRSEGFETIANRLGYRPVRRLSTMERPLPIETSAAFPAGIALRSFTVGRDENAWLAVNNAAFAGHRENGGLTRDDLRLRMETDWFRPEDILMAWDDDELAGSCWTKRHPDLVGEIYVIGVHPRYQGRGLGKALVVAGLNHLGEVAAARTGMLYVDHQAAGAMAMYGRLGFEPVRVTTMYEPATERVVPAR